MTEQERPRTEAPLLPGEYRVRGWDRFWSRLEDAMSEQERPRTEAGRKLLAAMRTATANPAGLQAAILAIEAEGRQQAVREIRDDFVEEWANPNPGQSMSRERRKAMLDWAETRKRRTLAILDRVAGNASESPPTGPPDPLCPTCDAKGTVIVAHKRDCPNAEDGDYPRSWPLPVGDASESPPTRPDIVCTADEMNAALWYLHDHNMGITAETIMERLAFISNGGYPMLIDAANPVHWGDASESGQRDFSADALTLDRIPARDASESPPTACGCQCHGPYVWDACPHCRPDLLGDASESDQPPDSRP